jgi:hypothetical protein
VVGEVRDRVADRGHRRHLELHLHEVRVEVLEQHGVGQPAVLEPRFLEALVVQDLLHPVALRASAISLYSAAARLTSSSVVTPERRAQRR